MEDDTPQKIAILGSGPIGLEAALYARFLGFDVDIFERGEIAANVRRWGHVRMFTPFSMNTTSLGVAAIQAQGESVLPSADELLTGNEFVDRYLIPLANTDLVSDHIHQQHDVISVGRTGLLKNEIVPRDIRAEKAFRILVRDSKGIESIHHADIVIDSAGNYSSGAWLGDGGIPAIGEASLMDVIERYIPTVIGADKPKYANKHTLLVGNGYSAATTIVSFGELIRTEPETRLTCVVRKPCGGKPIAEIENDRLPERQSIACRANELVSSSQQIHLRESTCVNALRKTGDGQLEVRLSDDDQPLTVDNIIANVGYRPDNRLNRELQVHRCYASEGPMKLAASLLQDGASDCLDQKGHGPDTLITTEPDFYVLGGKSYGRNSNFLLGIGHDQIRDVFTLIGERNDLDLYRTMQPAP